MTDTPEAVAAPVADTVLVTEFPNLPGARSIDCAAIPANVRLDFLKNAVRGYAANRLNSATQRYAKDETVLAWDAYNKATAADPLQSVVAKPEKPLPAAPDLEDVLSRAIADLTSGNVRKQGDGTKARVTVDPLTKLVTDTVVREVHKSKSATDPKYTFLKAKADVGADGIAYLNATIAAKVEAAEAAVPGSGAELRTALGKMLETRYLAPAKQMLGISTTKAQSALPSIL